MTIILDPYTIPEKGQVELNVSRSFEIKITAEEARRQINRWLMNEVNLLISADLPTLVVGDQVVWRAMAWISFPHTGRAGMVGAVEINVTTGAMNNTLELKAEIERRAEEVANRQPPYRAKDKVPERYLAKNVPPAPTLHIQEDGTLAIVTASEQEHA